MKPLPVVCALLAVLTAPPASRASLDHADANVTIHGFGFKPDTLVVPMGTSVLWTNEDEIDHTVTADSGGLAPFNGVLAGAGKTFRYSFTRAGAYPYACARHSFMRGIIRVTSMGDH